MINVDVLYLTKNSRSTTIVYLDKTVTYQQTIESILNEACLGSLSTLEGRIKAIRELYGFHKYTPLYISNDIILLPTTNSKDWNYTLVNTCNVKGLEEIDKQTIVRFINDITLKVDLPIRRMNQYLENCLKVKFKQKEILKGINYGKEKY